MNPMGLDSDNVTEKVVKELDVKKMDQSLVQRRNFLHVCK